MTMTKTQVRRFVRLLLRRVAPCSFIALVGVASSVIFVRRSSFAHTWSPQISRFQTSACPKILMFGGVSYYTENNEAGAKYWGETVGVDGFFVLDLLDSWEYSVGDDENSGKYQGLKAFQQLYSKHGVTDNFVTIGLHKPHDWKTPAAQDNAVRNLRQAAHLARFAGFKGLALDLEFYVQGFWITDPTLPDKAERVYTLGKRIGYAIWAEYPEATVIVLPEVLNYRCPPFPQSTCDAYALSGRFWDGLVQGHLPQVLLATEQTYDASQPDLVANNVWDIYRADLQRNGVDLNTVHMAPGLWPLGKTYTDKSAHWPPSQFAQRLQVLSRQKLPYIWIYCHGSAWEENGAYGKGHVDPQFNQFLNVLHQFKQSCSGRR